MSARVEKNFIEIHVKKSCKLLFVFNYAQIYVGIVHTQMYTYKHNVYRYVCRYMHEDSMFTSISWHSVYVVLIIFSVKHASQAYERSSKRKFSK